MAAGESLDAVLAATRGALELIRLGQPPAGAEVRAVDGALTDAVLRERPARPGESLWRGTSPRSSSPPTTGEP